MNHVSVNVLLARHDALWPRDLEHRFRLYGRLGDELTVLAASPDMGGIGVALGTLDEEALAVPGGAGLGDYGAVGVLDVLPASGRDGGRWVISPWHRGETR